MPLPSAYIPAGLGIGNPAGVLASLDFIHRGYLVAGVVGAAIPILIHLLTRDRVKRVAFSSIRFFLKSNRRILRRRKFREMMLLAMRVIACALLAVAFARPFVKAAEARQPGGVKAATARVIVADVSASMARAGIKAQLRKEAQAAVESLSAGTDAAALITFADFPTIDAPLSTDLAEVRSKVGSLAPGHGGTNIPEALRRADAELRRAEAPRKEIVLISDLQRTGWQDLKEDFKLSPGVKLDVRGVRGEGQGGNLAIAGGSCPATAVQDREAREVTVQIANYSDRPQEGVEVKFTAGGKTESRKVNLRPGGAAAATFRHVFDAPGDNPGTVSISGDGQPGDNVFYFNTRVIPKIKVALIDGSPSAAGPSEAAFYVETALTLGRNPGSPFDCRVLGAQEVSAADLREVRVAILCDVAALAPDVRRALGELLRRGGGLLFLPGDAVETKTFAESFAALAPCKLGRILSGRALRGGGTGASLSKIDFQHPIFEIFSYPRHGDLALAKFQRYWEVTDSQLSAVPARFDDNRPALVLKEIDGGISMLLASCVGESWTDLPRQATFLPLLWQGLKYLAARTEQATAYTVGDSLPVPKDHHLKGPDGQTAERSIPAAAPGFYTLIGPSGQTVLTYAVNRNPAESAPGTVAAEEIVAAVVSTAQAGTPAGQVGPEDARKQKDDQGLWSYLLAAIAVLLAGELLLGNRTLRH